LRGLATNIICGFATCGVRRLTSPIGNSAIFVFSRNALRLIHFLDRSIGARGADKVSLGAGEAGRSDH
jgi:hypothetical protein